MKTLYMIRGLPGSGKSTLAKRMADLFGCRYYEADQWFEGADGSYNFDPRELGAAHRHCFENTMRDLKNGNVIVSNTFTTHREMVDYIEHALAMGASIKVIHCTGDYGSVHNVPRETIERMKTRWLDNEKLADMHNGITVCTW